jgi:hypothetical protein
MFYGLPEGWAPELSMEDTVWQYTLPRTEAVALTTDC